MGELRDDREREDRGSGAALGAHGSAGFFTWRNRRAVRGAIDDVPPGTWRGALNVTAWFAGWVAIGLIVSVWLPPIVAAVVGLVVMVFVGRWWDGQRAAERPLGPPDG